MEEAVLVYVDLKGAPIFVGKLWAKVKGKKQTAAFEYDKDWLHDPRRFALEPALALGEGAFYTEADRALFGSLGDSAPDRWGRALMRRAQRARAKKINETPRTLWEIDFLLMVDDFARQGALRFKREGQEGFLAKHSSQSIPPLIELPKLLSATRHIAQDSETAQELRLLLAPGSSLGGARPKASVIDNDGNLLIAKFPHKDDEIDIVKWEAVALSLAKAAKIEVPNWRLENINQDSVLLIERFDRRGLKRIPFLSAMSMLSARDNEDHSYLEIVDAIRRFGAIAKKDMQSLWRRIVFNISIANTDDHLRNHGFLLKGEGGWCLSPAYDLNPVPIDIKPRILSTNITIDDATGSIELALEVIEYFDLTLTEAKSIIEEITSAVSRWRSVASKIGLTKKDIERMSSAFL